MAEQHWSTGGLSERDAFPAWESAVKDAFVPLSVECPPPGRFAGTIASHSVAGLRVTTVAAVPHRVRRTSTLIRRTSAPDYYKLCLQVSGSSAISQDGRTAVLAPGDIAIYDTSRPYELNLSSAYSQQVTVLPTSLLRSRPEDVAKVTATAWPSAGGLAGLLGDVMRSLPRQAADLHPGQDNVAERITIDLLDSVIDERLGSLEELRDGPQYLAAVAFIEHNLADPALTPAVVAAAQFMSMRSLQVMFAKRGQTPSGLIRQRRLARCAEELAAPTATRRSMSEIAARWGFPDSSHFSRAFAAAYGVPPRAYRAQRTGAVGA